MLWFRKDNYKADDIWTFKTINIIKQKICDDTNSDSIISGKYGLEAEAGSLHYKQLKVNPTTT